MSPAWHTHPLLKPQCEALSLWCLRTQNRLSFTFYSLTGKSLHRQKARQITNADFFLRAMCSRGHHTSANRGRRGASTPYPRLL